MKYINLSVLILFLLFKLPISYSFPSGTHQILIPKTQGIREELLTKIAPIVDQSIRDNSYPGAVVLAGHRGKIIYQGIFGNQQILPTLKPMRANTIFDVASLTKVIATAPAIMQLVEQGKIELDSKVATYWPLFGKGGKEQITIRQLLTHTSGLPVDVEPGSKESVYHHIEQMKLKKKDVKFVYSDVNFIVLAHLVELISHEEFGHYVNSHIFKPLGMKHTFFLPPKSLRDQIAPTLFSEKKQKWGDVQDPIAHAMGGIAGHAGLFSNANDLAIYAQSLLDGGRGMHGHILSPLTILKMTTPQTPASISNVRALGWDMDSMYSNRGELFTTRSFGHTGWTGTSIWIDPPTQTWLIILTNRIHPKPPKENRLIVDRKKIANVISASIIDISVVSQNNTGQGELSRAFIRN